MHNSLSFKLARWLVVAVLLAIGVFAVSAALPTKAAAVYADYEVVHGVVRDGSTGLPLNGGAVPGSWDSLTVVLASWSPYGFFSAFAYLPVAADGSWSAMVSQGMLSTDTTYTVYVMANNMPVFSWDPGLDTFKYTAPGQTVNSTMWPVREVATGRVTYKESGLPVAGAKVELKSSLVPYYCYTSSDGTYTLNGPAKPGPLSISTFDPSAPNEFNKPTVTATYAGSKLTQDLQIGKVIRGQLYSTFTGAPLGCPAYGSIEQYDAYNDQWVQVASWSADSVGGFSVGQWGMGTASPFGNNGSLCRVRWLGVMTGSYADGTSDTFVYDDTTETVLPKIWMTPQVAGHIALSDTKTSKPVQLELFAFDGTNYFSIDKREVDSGPDGFVYTFSATRLPLDYDFRIVATNPDYKTSQMDFRLSAAKPSAHFDTTLAKLTPTITGVVTGSGTPLGRIVVTAFDANTHASVKGVFTEKSGEYTIANLPVGSYHLRFTGTTPTELTQFYDRSMTIGGASAISVGATETVTVTTDLTPLYVPVTTSIAGTITNGGLPLNRIVVTAFDAGTHASVKGVFTDAAGNYSLSGLAPGSYHLRFTGTTPASLAQYNDHKTTMTAADEIVVSGSGAPVIVSSDLAPPPAPIQTISGTVTNASAPLNRIVVTAFDATTHASVKGVFTDATGAYALSLPAGSYHLRFTGTTPANLTQFFDHQARIGNASVVTLASGATVSVSSDLSGPIAP
jgi:hypothetical protein